MSDGVREEALRLRIEGFHMSEIAKRCGVSRQRIAYLLKPPTAVRQAVVLRDGECCADCGVHVGSRGHVHHRFVTGLGADDYHDVANLVLLCASCHRQAHLNGPKKGPRIPANHAVAVETCPTHAINLRLQPYCPMCRAEHGAKGGRQKSPRKTAATRANAQRATILRHKEPTA